MTDQRHKQIGGRHRALARWSMLIHRTTHTDLPKNTCYAGVEVRVEKEDFIDWFTERDFEGCSVDRIDSCGHYELSNMQLIDKRLNIAKDKLKAHDGKTTCSRCGETKPLEEFTRDRRRLVTGRTTTCKVCDRQRYHSRKARRQQEAA